MLVLKVQPGGAAEEAGFEPTVVDEDEQIRLGDVIVEIDGATVRSSEELFEILDARSVGDTVVVTLVRSARTNGEKKITKEVILKPLP